MWPTSIPDVCGEQSNEEILKRRGLDHGEEVVLGQKLRRIWGLESRTMMTL